jgi:hypothetical protein
MNQSTLFESCARRHFLERQYLLRLMIERKSKLLQVPRNNMKNHSLWGRPGKSLDHRMHSSYTASNTTPKSKRHTQTSAIMTSVSPPSNPQTQLTRPAIILGKQWKDEPDDIKAQYKAQAEELKRQHARDHPDYQYTPRKPSEKKRRASSRQHPRHASMLRTGGSPTSTTSNASTPVLPPGFQQGHGQGQGNAAGEMQAPMSMPMQMQMQMRGDGGGGMNVVLGPDDAVSEQAFGLDAEAFSALVQQVNNGRVGAGGSASGGSGGDGRYWMYHGLNSAAGAEQAAADSFEFSDFITDFY